MILERNGKSDLANVLLGEMKKKQIKPDVVIYNIIVNHLCSEGKKSICSESRGPEAYGTLKEMHIILTLYNYFINT